MHPLKKKIQQSFDKSSSLYDINAKLQIDVLQELFNFFFSEYKSTDPLEQVKFLDLGCGTGECGKLFSDRLKPKKIHLLDISKEMLINSKKKFLKKDVILHHSDFDNFKKFQDYDFITSNMSLHWSCDFFNLMCRIVNSVKSGSIILISYPSFIEMDDLSQKNNDLINDFPDSNVLIKLIDKEKFVLKEKEMIFTETFDSELEFLKSLKIIGANVSNKKKKKIFYLRRNLKKINVKYKVQIVYLRKI